jgi:hypothetical protein
MSKRLLLLLDLLIIAISILVMNLGCAPKQREIKGQAYVLMKNGNTLKLSVADVSLFEAERIRPWLSNSLASAQAELEDMEARRKEWIKKSDKISEEILSLESERNALGLKIDLAKEARDEAKRNALAARTKERLAEARAEFATQEKLISELTESRWNKNSELSSKQDEKKKADALAVDWAAQIYGFDPTAKIFSSLPPAASRVRTDADGEFIFKVPVQNDYYVAVAFTREILDSSEKYYWLLPVGHASERLLLNNANMFDGRRLADLLANK